MPLGPSVEPPTPRKALPALRVLGQVQNTYIAAEGPDGMYLIDQHAAHERVVFEKVMAATLTKRADVQSLLEPATVELDPGQQGLVESHRELMARMGLHVEAFGGRTYLLRGVPSVLAHGDPAQAFLDVLDTMAEGGGFESWEERAAYSIACHSAIRAGKTLSPQEMSELTRQLEECRQPNTCPHGRPTMIHLSAGHLEREFGRR
jgi:DNA mismatch repair protein MutL